MRIQKKVSLTMGRFQNIMINVILDKVDHGRSWEILSGQGEDSIGKNTNFRWKGGYGNVPWKTGLRSSVFL